MDAISYSHSVKQEKRIKKFNTNPDSNSGVLTQPRVIEAGETVTIKSGRQAILADTVIDGDLVIEAGADVFIPTGSSVDFSNGIKVNGENLVMSIPTAYHIYNGSIEATNTEITNGFSTTLYTGNGGTQDVITGVDMSSQWGDDASEMFGGLVWLKSRIHGDRNALFDTVRGVLKSVFTNTTADEAIASDFELSTFNNNGFSVLDGIVTNRNLGNFVSWNFQTTHRKTGVTNQGKAYTEHYNPFTGFTIIKYEGSGISGHEIPHSLGRKLWFATVKNLGVVTDWQAYTDNGVMMLNLTNALTVTNAAHTFTDTYFVNNNGGNANNASTNQYIMYGWANSYFDESNKLIGNYEIGTYQGTGAAGNKVKTRGKPAWVMIKRLDSTGDWIVQDNLRPVGYWLRPNTNAVEQGIGYFGFNLDGFTLNGIAGSPLELNVSGGQYLYMVVYDNDSGSGKSKYPKETDTTNLSINALVPYANGIDTNGSKVSIEYKNETITGLTLTEGKNYLYSKNDGTYGVSMIAPSYGIENTLTGDFFNLKTLRWYDNTNAEITPRTYLDCVVNADNNGQVTYVEELPKIEYKDIIKANEYQGKNACTAWVNFDGTTTPPTIRGSYNVSSVVRIGTGIYEFYFDNEMENLNYVVNATHGISGVNIFPTSHNKHLNKVVVYTYASNGVLMNAIDINIQIFGGKN